VKPVDRRILLEIAAREGVLPEQLAALELGQGATPIERLALWALRKKALDAAGRIERGLIGSGGRPGRPKAVDALDVARRVDEARKEQPNMSLKQATNVVAPLYPGVSPTTLEKAYRRGLKILIETDPGYRPVVTKKEASAKLREVEKKYIG
jgi:hypothetical protein